jgi:hypothetical protein
MAIPENDNSALINGLMQMFAPGRSTSETTSSNLSPEQANAIAQNMMSGQSGLSSVLGQQRAAGMRGSSSAYFGGSALLAKIAAEVAARQASTTRTTTSVAPNLGLGGGLASTYALGKLIDPNGDKLKAIGDWMFGGGQAAGGIGAMGPSATQMGGASAGVGADTSGMGALLSWFDSIGKGNGSAVAGDAGPGALLAAGSQGVAGAAASGAASTGASVSSDPTSWNWGDAGSSTAGAPGGPGVGSSLASLPMILNTFNGYNEKNQAPALLTAIGMILGGPTGGSVGNAIGNSGPGQDLSAGIYHTGQVLPEAGDKLQEGWDKLSGGIANSGISTGLNNLGGGIGSAASGISSGLGDIGSGIESGVSDLGTSLGINIPPISSWLHW